MPTTLLLSDDSLLTQRMVAMTLAPENITVIPVNDGESAIERIRRERPDIVLASIPTPGRSGYDVSAFVKSTPGLSAIPVLLVAAAFDRVDQTRVEHARCDGVLVKPFEPQLLVARVRELLNKPPAPAQPPAAAAGLDSYFEQLDAAIARRSAPAAESTTREEAAVPTLDSVLAAAPSPPPATLPAITDEFIDEVSRRVAERLGTPAVRQVIAEVVADTAERLVREEIARIRGKG